MLCGLTKLTSYSKNFIKAKNLCIVFLVYFTVFGVLWSLYMTNIFDFTKNTFILGADDFIYYCIFVSFTCVLSRALGDISAQVGFEKGIAREKRSVSLAIVFGIFTLLRFSLSPFGFDVYLRGPLVLFELFCLVYTAVYLYSCYMMIATQEIIDNENKKMREYRERNSLHTQKNRHK